jgi:hypothetical protein
MSIIKSSVINLYDGEGTHNFQSKVSSDRVELQSNTLPINLKGTSISLSNQGGDTINDVVGVMQSILSQLVNINDQLNHLQIGDSSISTLLADVIITPAPKTYKLAEMIGSFNIIIRITHADGSELSNDEKTALVGVSFTYRDLSNTASIKFTGVHPNGLYLGWDMPGVPLGTDIIIIESVEITGPRNADYILLGYSDEENVSKITITYTDNSELSPRDKTELLGRSFTHTSYDNTARIRFSNVDASGFDVTGLASDLEIGTKIFLV